MNLRAFLLATLLALAPGVVAAATPAASAPMQFRDAAEETRFRNLAAELRCVMCQNQSLADSDAPIAHDLRRQVLELMRAGRTDAQVKQYLVERYSEFVLYEPPVRPLTWLLWFGPLLLLAGGGLLIATVVRRRARALPVAGSAPSNPDEPEQEW
ncbi:MAG: cytochrome c-type biogenesis protein [Arenimonas sp.]